MYLPINEVLFKSMTKIKICKSVFMKVNCFPEHLDIYDTWEDREEKSIEEGQSLK